MLFCVPTIRGLHPRYIYFTSHFNNLRAAFYPSNKVCLHVAMVTKLLLTNSSFSNHSPYLFDVVHKAGGQVSPHWGKARTVQVVWVYKVVQLVSKILEIGQAIGCCCCHRNDTFPVALKPCAVCVWGAGGGRAVVCGCVWVWVCECVTIVSYTYHLRLHLNQLLRHIFFHLA